ncbi:hypothetical protein B5K05_01340 [Rhizobium phaseoli]|uniref:hypothetical protein n=1 Tax=Rhizobium phaseoli TaxID=396 RepID=UPI000E0CD96B|nr:hypothetical protein [Rhizobium phaseoli]RDJ18363.1 hypothetical protein B5K04_01335 [Rhizobium phaseoli]RDJ19455.1 hypothetical protein B5K05_01340 [Rhizobium phaseoli]
MFAIDDIRLIKDQLIKIKRSSYFEKPLLEHSKSLISLIEHIDQNESAIDPRIMMEVRRILFSEQMFLSGSVSGEVPYEVVYSLKQALSDWGHQNDLITTALLDDQNFYFLPSKGIWRFVQNAIPSFQLPATQYSLIQVAFPRLYRTKPLFAIPLYHELGHFIDITNRVSELVLLSSNPGPPANYRHIVLNHLREHFADLFAANYCGELATELLPLLAGYQSDSETHPATAKRIQVVADFLSGNANPLVNVFQAALNQRNLPSLMRRYIVPAAGSFFDNMRPLKLESVEEIHGIYIAATRYLNDRRANAAGVWTGQPIREIVRIVNDLVEKSIRNYDVTQRWNSGNP